jgi:hypothetical protein
VNKLFEPFFDLWDSAEKWLSNKEAWTNGPFIELDAENVEGAVTVLLRNLAKSAKTFERLNLAQVNVIAAQVRDEVDLFRPKVPLIVALRNPGMRDRHWQDLTEKSACDLPADKSKMTLQVHTCILIYIYVYVYVFINIHMCISIYMIIYIIQKISIHAYICVHM